MRVPRRRPSCTRHSCTCDRGERERERAYACTCARGGGREREKERKREREKERKREREKERKREREREPMAVTKRHQTKTSYKHVNLHSHLWKQLTHSVNLQGSWQKRDNFICTHTHTHTHTHTQARAKHDTAHAQDRSDLSVSKASTQTYGKSHCPFPRMEPVHSDSQIGVMTLRIAPSARDIPPPS